MIHCRGVEQPTICRFVDKLQRCECGIAFTDVVPDVDTRPRRPVGADRYTLYGLPERWNEVAVLGLYLGLLVCWGVCESGVEPGGDDVERVYLGAPISECMQI